mmetsp:Transcript_5523/g.10381  ORF Transcript_5523/g.10381 Transcript_5523/m.10381 type:complete len:683 (+) Transcript_5523:274-2322(+)
MEFKAFHRTVLRLNNRGLGSEEFAGDGDYGGCASSSGGTPGSSMPVPVKYSWVVAVVLCIVSAFIINFGTNIQKLAWNRRKKALLASQQDAGENAVDESVLSSGEADTEALQNQESTHPDKDESFRRLWTIGFICLVGGSIFDFAALAFGAQSIVAPLGSISLVANMIFAQVMHGEQLSKRDVLATIVIIFGCVVSVAFASHKNEICDIDTLLALYGEPRFAIYAGVILSLLACGMIFAQYIEAVEAASGIQSPEYLALFKYHRFVYTFLSGVAGAQSVLFAKSLDELLVSSFAGDSRIFLAHMGSYMIAFSMFCTIGLQIYWLNCGLAKWDALYIVPVFQAQWIVFSVIGGGVFYGEFSGFSFGQVVAFCVGIALTVLGVYILSQRDVRDQDEEGLENEREVLNETLDTPLLDTSRSSFQSYSSALNSSRASGFGPSVEYHVTFHAQNLGFAVEPCTVGRAVTSFQPGSPAKVLRAWRVKSVSGARNTQLRVGHYIAAVESTPVIGTGIPLPEVLKMISAAPRPITIKFQSRPEASVAVADHGESAASQRLEDSNLGNLLEGSFTYYNSFDGDTTSGTSSPRLGRPSLPLSRVTMNPFLGLIHQFGESSPAAFERLASASGPPRSGTPQSTTFARNDNNLFEDDARSIASAPTARIVPVTSEIDLEAVSVGESGTPPKPEN